MKVFGAGKLFLKSLFAVAVVPALSAWGGAYAETMPQAKFVDVNGYRTRYFEAGTGEVLVLVHGGSFGTTANAEGWRSIFGGLAKHLHVYAFDKLGMGETDNPRSDEEYSMKATIDHAYGFLRQVGIQQASLAGHSRGALPVTRIAVDHPEMVRRLIIFDSSTVSPRDPSSPVELQIVDWYDRQEASQPPPNLTPKVRQAKEKMELLRSRFVERNRDRLEKDPALGVIRSPAPWWLSNIKYETLDLIKAGRLKAPTLIIWGFNDPSAPVILGWNLLNVIAPVVEHTQFHVFNKAEHSVYGDHPQETIRLVVDFIKNSPQ